MTGSRVLNWKRARMVAHAEGIQLSQDALVLLDEAAQRTILKATERAKLLGRHRITGGLIMGVLEIE